MLSAHPEFDRARFSRGLKRQLESLELKARMLCIADRLQASLPEEPEILFPILVAALAKDENDPVGLRSFSVWPLTEMVSQRGLENLPLAMDALCEMTIRFTGEFAIRRFLLERPKETFQKLETWVKDPNEHVRRLVSEGTRPLLPWGGALPSVMQNPQTTLVLLEQLHTDDSEYVRRSVANHLNDFSKKHPALVVETLRRWKKAKHLGFSSLANRAARTLVKQGHPGALALFGFDANPNLEVAPLELSEKVVQLGGQLSYRFQVVNLGRGTVSILFDYAIYHLKNNGSHSVKVFKGRKKELVPGEIWEVQGMHPFRQITTRRYHAGEHRMEILLNGKSQGLAIFELRI